MNRGTGRQDAIDGAPTLTSLLWPANYSRDADPAAELDADTVADLDLGPIVQALSGYDPGREPFVRSLLTRLNTDPAVIVYRAHVISNVLEETELRDRLAGLLSALAPLARDRHRPIFGVEWSVTEIVERLRELEQYVEAALAVSRAVDTPSLRAPALLALRASIDALTGTEEFQRLRDELPALRDRLDAIQSVTIGINLSPGLQPESATILSLDPDRIERRAGILRRLFGRDRARSGITPLRGEPGSPLRAFFPLMAGDGRGHDNELVRDLRRLLERAAAPVGDVIGRYVSVQTRDFVRLESELSFLLNAAGLVERLRRAGLPTTFPELLPADARTTCLDEAYNLSLALRLLGTDPSSPGRAAEIVTNPVAFGGDAARIWILTGPNRGGKTTYARAAGLAHILFQSGLPVPARRARMSPLDRVYTHFPSQETATPGEGRLDEEARRLARIFGEATPCSLVLLNEVLSGTSTIEALALARDAVRGLRLLGVRAIYVTHLHELAAHAAEINQTTPGDAAVGSLVAEVAEAAEEVDGPHGRTFRIRPGAPRGLSYASEIARQHGISYAQVTALLRARGLLPP